MTDYAAPRDPQSGPKAAPWKKAERGFAEDRFSLVRVWITYSTSVRTRARPYSLYPALIPGQHRVSRDCHWERTKIATSAHNVSVLRKSLVHSRFLLLLNSFCFILFTETNF